MGLCVENKNGVSEKFKTWKTLVETQTNKKIRRLKTDNGLDFCNKRFEDLCTEHEM